MANTLRFKRGLVAGIPTAAAGEPLFTTDTFDLYIGNGTTNTRFQKYIASGTTSQLLRGDGSLLTMPIVLTSPSTGQVLKYNGTSWVNDSDAGITGSLTTNYIPRATGASTLGNSVLFQGTRALGIQTATPVDFGLGTYNLHLHDDGIPLIQFTNSTTGQTSSVGSRIQLNGNDLLFINSQATGIFRWLLNGAERFRVTSGGNFIINNASTDNGLRFQVTGDGYFSGSLGIGVSPAAKLHIGESGAAAQLWLQRTDGYNPVKLIGGTLGDGNGFKITMNTTDVLNLTSSGNLGLGVVPSAWSGATSLTIPNGGQFGSSGPIITMFANSYYNAPNYIYTTSAAASLYQQVNAEHRWSIAPSGTAGNAISFVQAMTLDASGNLGLGTATPQAVRNRYFDISNTSGSNGVGLSLSPSSTGLATIRLGNAANVGYDINYNDSTIGSGSLGIYSNSATTYRISLFSDGNVGIGTTTNATYKLDVNGTMRVSGASTISSTLAIGGAAISRANALRLNGASVTQSSNTYNAYISSNTSQGVDIGGSLGLGGEIGGGDNAAFAVISGRKENSTSGNYAGYFAISTIDGGAAMTEKFRIASTGAATFSSSVTANTSINGYQGGVHNLLIDFSASSQVTTLTNTELFFGTNAQRRMTISSGGNVLVGDTNNPGNRIIAYQNTTHSSENSYSIAAANASSTGKKMMLGYDVTLDVGLIAAADTGVSWKNISIPWGNVGIANTNPSYKLDVTGEARVSNAIAIGTTPDTNKPFKILKNINGTVGINFENTSTGASAFSAIQMGTDVSGGTKFTNLVYSSSGVTASGVYQPDGTSLINNGSGGLNFLGNPIRMYTGGSNGTLRWDMTNDGFITQYSGTNPTTNATDGYRQYSADVVAGNAAPHFRTENGAIIKLYQETTGVGNSIISLGGGNAVLDDTTFDGYTLRQIVKALRNQGILA